jgi:XRE family transcriptional regulator, aerobic/anaerobic benzoate catabolism transcriptional regulator
MDAEIARHDTDGATRLLEEAGARVRQLRSRRGMSRRTLSEHANISERYLGQLEKGRANVTLGLLHRIAGALDEPLTAFLPVDDAPARISPPLLDLLAAMTEAEQAGALRLLTAEFDRPVAALRGVALIGMRGAGKTTLGRGLASSCGVPFIRLSDVIQEIGGMEIGELVEMTGQNAYRRLEHQALEHILHTEPRAVVEAGGGLVSEPRTFGLLTRHFRTVWIRATPEEHMQRVIDQGDLRPMAGNREAMADLEAILRERDPFYRQADHVLDTSRRTADDCLVELKTLCETALAG